VADDTQTLPFDFGEFSLRSLGITLTLPEQVMQRYPKIALASLHRFRSGDERIDFFRQLFQDEPDDAAKFAVVGYASVFAHEIRHYHDYLATPFGAATMIDLMLAARYLPLIYYLLRDEQSIGLPLQAWEKLSSRLHRVYQQQPGHGSFKENPPEGTGRFTASADAILSRVHARLGRSRQHPEGTLETRDILEASALSIQTEQIERIFDYPTAVTFANNVREQAGTETYSRLWQLFNTAAADISPGFFFSPAVANAIILFALCGTDKEGEEWSHPADRINAVLGYLLYSKEFPTEENILDILEYCSKIYNIPTMAQSLEESVDFTARFAKGLRIEWEKDTETLGVELSDDKLYNCFDSWVAAHEQMVSRILQAPLTYCEPKLYLSLINDWAAAPVYLAGSGPAFSVESPLVKNLRDAGWIEVWGEGDLKYSPDEIVQVELMHGPEMTEGSPVLLREEAQFLSLTIWMTYAIWSQGMLHPNHRRVAVAALRGANPGWNVLLL